jgi:hypothetical protein
VGITPVGGEWDPGVELSTCFVELSHWSRKRAEPALNLGSDCETLVQQIRSFRRTSSGRRRSRRECLVGRPRSPFAEGVENKLPQGVPEGACCATDRCLVAAAPPLPRPRLHTSAACRRAGRRPSVSRPFDEVGSLGFQMPELRD